MCGIVGFVGGLGKDHLVSSSDITPLLITGLRRLEYRGYDSAGVATLINGKIERRRANGKLKALEDVLQTHPLTGSIGIGHTRWATHGKPSEVNSHPHMAGGVVLVHNGIIENHKHLAEEIKAKGRTFESETDTEVVAHLIDMELSKGATPLEASERTFDRLEGAFSLALMFAGNENLLIAVRQGTPLAVGIHSTQTGAALSSDATAFADVCDQVCFLDDGDIAILNSDGVQLRHNGADKSIVFSPNHLTGALIGKENYPHFMLKEIYEQPDAIANSLQGGLGPDLTSESLALNLPFDARSPDIDITLIACGTAHYACQVGALWLERWARIPANAKIASEYRYHDAPASKAVLAVSQSGETLDTLEALRLGKSRGQATVSIINTLESTIGRESDLVLYTHAGPEIGVASTKAFTSQLTILCRFALALAQTRGTLERDTLKSLCTALETIPGHINQALGESAHIETIADTLRTAKGALFLGRGLAAPIALEGALKLTEISYIHAQGYPAGEMKHGPIALIESDYPVFVIAMSDNLLSKTIANAQEVMARGANVVAIVDTDSALALKAIGAQTIVLPRTHPDLIPLLAAIPLQLIAYYTARLKGLDVDQPRNLAKAVTVE